jgi:ribosomal-protein-alanine N-acetyltransferase
MSAVLNDPEVFLRPMRNEDIDEVMQVELAAYPFPWTHGIFRDCMRVGYSCWLIESLGKIVAYGIMSSAVGEAHILNICVDVKVRRRGFGLAILEHLVELARHHKNEVCLLEVRPSNTAALSLYHNFGFNEVGTRKNYYPDGAQREDAIILALNLL